MQTEHAMDIVNVLVNSPNPDHPERTGIPVLLIGPPGIGKTDRAADIAAQNGGNLYTAIGSTMQPEDVAGLPHIAHGRTEWTEPELVWRAKLDTTCPVFLFFDEIDKASREVQDALLHVVQQGKCGPHELPLNTRIILAANPPGAGGRTSLNAAMTNRVAWVYLDADAKEWVKWASDLVPFSPRRKRQTETMRQVSRDEWLWWWPITQSNFIGYLTARPDAIVTDRKDVNTVTGAYNMPRSITNAMYAATTAAAMGRLDLVGGVIASLVGDAWATEYLAYIAEANLTPPADLLNAGVPLPMPLCDATRPDIALAMVNGLISHTRLWANDKRPHVSEAERYWHVCTVMAEAFPDMAMMLSEHALNSSIPALRATSAAADAMRSALKLTQTR